MSTIPVQEEVPVEVAVPVELAPTETPVATTIESIAAPHEHVPDEHYQEPIAPSPFVYPPEDESLVDVLFLTRNRLEFTVESLTALRCTTDWSLVNRLWLYDDQSEDGTDRYLEHASQSFVRMGIQVSLRTGAWNSPLAVLLDCVKGNPCGRIAKVDNDALMPPGWLNIATDVLNRNPELDLLGIGYRDDYRPDDPPTTFSFTPARFVGGIGLFRIRVLRGIPIAEYDLRQWNGINQADMNVGWLTPGLPVILLDKIRFEPWKTYAARYCQCGYHRDWGKYSPKEDFFDWWSDSFHPIPNPYYIPKE